jgi:hypothetical protein
VCLEGGVKALARRTATGQFLHSIRKSRDKSRRISSAHERLSVATGWWEQGNPRIHYDRFNQNEQRGRGSIRKLTPVPFASVAQPAVRSAGAACTLRASSERRPQRGCTRGWSSIRVPLRLGVDQGSNRRLRQAADEAAWPPGVGTKRGWGANRKLTPVPFPCSGRQLYGKY